MPVGNAPVSCARGEFRVANSKVPRMSARDQLAETLRCLGTSGVLNVCRSECASGMTTPSAATSHETISNIAPGVPLFARQTGTTTRRFRFRVTRWSRSVNPHVDAPGAGACAWLPRFCRDRVRSWAKFPCQHHVETLMGRAPGHDRPSGRCSPQYQRPRRPALRWTP